MLKSLIFNQDKIIIGRILSVDLVIDDISISRIHAAINVSDDGIVTVSDLGSVNGVEIKGEKITEAEIKSGNQFTLGDIDIQVTVFKEEDIQESPQPRIPIVNFYSELEDIVDLKKKAGTRTMVVTPKEGGESVSVQSNLSSIFPIDRNRERATVLEGVLFLNDSVLEVKHLHQPRNIMVGGHSACDFNFAPELLKSKFKLVKCIKGKYFVTIKEEMKGFVQKDSRKNISLDRIKNDPSTKVAGDNYTFPIGHRDIVRIEVGNASFLFMFVEQSEPLAKKNMVESDPPYHTSLFISFVLHLLMVLIFINAEVPKNIKLEKIDDRFVKLIIQNKKPEAKKKILAKKRKPKKVIVKKAKKPKKAPPKKVVKKAPPKKKAVAKKQKVVPPKIQIDQTRKTKNVVKPQKKISRTKIVSAKGKGDGRGFKRKAPKSVKSVGILGALKGKGAPGSLSKMFGKRGIGRGNNVNVVGPRGVKGGRGSFGLRKVRGGGVGKTFGIGSGNVLGGGGGGTPGVVNASGALRGRGGVSMSAFNGLKGSKYTGNSSMNSGNTVVIGSLTKDQIWSVIEKHFAEIQNCYEVALQGDKGLSGKVMMFWVIGGDGHVKTVRVKKTTLRNVYTETCMKNRIKHWVFPKPRGGGIVRVVFPFSFKPL
jgi:outer membrane biosynthesis protein TonB